MDLEPPATAVDTAVSSSADTSLDDAVGAGRGARLSRAGRSAALFALLATVALAAVTGCSSEPEKPTAAQNAAAKARTVQARETLQATVSVVSTYEAERANAPAWAKGQDKDTAKNLTNPRYRVAIADGVVKLTRSDKPRCSATVPTVHASKKAVTKGPVVTCGEHTYTDAELDNTTPAQRGGDVAMLATSIATSVKSLGDGKTTTVSKFTTRSLKKRYATVWGPDVDVKVLKAGSPAASLRVTARGCTVDATLADEPVLVSTPKCD